MPPKEVLGLDQRIPLGDLGHRQHVDLEAENLGHGGAALELLEALGRRGDRDRAALPVPRRLTRLGLETAVQLAGVARQLGHINRGSQLAH